MKKKFAGLRDTFIAGLIFLLPVLVLLALVSKVFLAFKKVTTKVADIFGLKSMLGISASTIAGTIGLLLLCIFCGYLIRIAFFKHISEWIDEKLRKLIPGYEVYHTMALSKLDNNEAALPYETAAWLNTGDGLQPAFVMETIPGGKIVLFLPTGGNVKEGNVLVLDESKVERCPDIDMKAFKLAIANLGLGLSKLAHK